MKKLLISLLALSAFFFTGSSNLIAHTEAPITIADGGDYGTGGG